MVFIVQCTQKPISVFFTIDYYTIFKFFLQIILDNLRKIDIIKNVERKALQKNFRKTGCKQTNLIRRSSV